MSDSPNKVPVRGARCAGCGGQRLHEVLVLRTAGGKVTRNMTCTGCYTTTRLGVCCGTCGDARLQTETTRHRGAATVRTKRCLGCGARTRTREVIEAGAV